MGIENTDRDQNLNVSPDASSPAGSEGMRRFRVLLGRSASAVSDQGLFALGNFAISMILARQMSQSAFGQFSAAFAAFILLSTVYCAFVVDPMLVYGGSTSQRTQRSYVRQVISLHWRIALVLSAVLIAVGVVRWQTGAGQGAILAYVGWALAAPAVLRLWFARRTAYLVMKPHYAAFAGGLYLLIIAGLLFGFGKYVSASVVTTCAIIGATSLSIALILHRSFRLADQDPAAGPPTETAGAHWRFGKWASIAGLLGLLPDYIYFFVLSPEQCGHYRALLNVVLPLIQVYNALGVLMMSYFARQRERADFTRIVLRTAAAYCGAAVLMAAAAVSIGGPLFYRLYGGKYELPWKLLLPLGVVSILFALKSVSDAVLRSLENVSSMAGIAVVGAVAAVVVGVPAALRFGIAGAVYGDLVVYCIATVAVAAVWAQRWRKSRARRDSLAETRGVQCAPLAVAEPSLES